MKPHKLKPCTVIFDGDDTLWDTMPIYTRAKRRFFSLMQRRGFDRRKVEKFFDERDANNVALWGFSRKRFRMSMLGTYDHFRRHASSGGVSGIREEIANLSDKVFVEAAGTTPYAGQVLSLLGLTCRLILLTMGDRAVQKQRLETSRLKNYFDEIVIVSHKDADTFRRLVLKHHLPPSQTWSVGNSLRSDINPALVAGLRAIWVPRRTWSYEDEQSIQRAGVVRISSLRSVPRIIQDAIEKATPHDLPV
jgi:putative hydrolase of the HAD superfamily